MGLFGRKGIVKPAECPVCQGDVLMPSLKAYRYAGEETGEVQSAIPQPENFQIA